jgi:tRNA1(Val) A37 N6-methylase TrmN6
VNILGHIFENSLNEIESVSAEIEGGEFDKQTSKRKKDGVFYTPKYITKYIVENTVGKLCLEKKEELGFEEEQYFRGRKNRNKDTLKKLVDILDEYREWLLQLTICDPACGSGAFLNQALDFLIKEHSYIDEMKARILGGGLQFPDIENTILENNIYGVDLNEESVEIAKLSLWLRTAQPRRKLNDLSSNVKCGNSLIDDKKVAGNKAFKWENEFPDVFEKGGFDVVIGNPPYVSSKGGNLSSIDKTYYLKNYYSSVYQIDLYILFLEKCANIISENGITSLIIPNAWLNNIYLAPVRKKILSEYKLYDFVEMPSNTFSDANVDTIIVSYGLKKRDPETSIFYFTNSELTEKFSSIQEDWLNGENFIINLSVDKAISNCLNTIEKNTIKLSDISRIGRGVGLYHKRVGHTKEFISQDPFQSQFIKDSTFKPYIKGRNINRWTTNWQKDSYVSYGDWLAEPRDMDFFEGSRILLRQIPSKLLYATEIEDIFITDQSVFIAKFKADSEINSKAVLGILNSKLMSFYFRFKHSEFDDLFPKVKLQHFKSFPISKSSEILLPFVTDIMQKAKLEIDQRFTFQRYLMSTYSLVNLSRKLQNWHDLDFGDFIKELNKAIKSTNKERAKEELEPIPTLTKKDEFEWMELFEENKKKALELQTQIDTTEKEIDQMVYELYGLSEEEIRIVENS